MTLQDREANAIKTQEDEDNFLTNALSATPYGVQREQPRTDQALPLRISDLPLVMTQDWVDKLASGMSKSPAAVETPKEGESDSES